MTQTLADLFIECLRRLDIGYAFGVPGQAIMPLFNAIYDARVPRAVLATHETSAAFSAIAYATLSGRPGVVLGTTGPGATNMMTGVATAYVEGVPLISVTGEVTLPQHATRAYQESTGYGRTIDIAAAMAPMCKRSARVVSASHFAELLATWIPLSRSGRPGPIHFLVPSDLWGQSLRQEQCDEVLKCVTQGLTRPTPTDSELVEIEALLRSAARPALLTGRGLAVGGGGDAATKLARAWGLPWFTTARGKGACPPDPDFSIGHLGPGASKDVSETFLKLAPDLLLSVGSSLSAMTIAPSFSAMPRPYIVQVNIDAEERGAQWKCDRFVHSDAAAFCLALSDRAPPGRRVPEARQTKVTELNGQALDDGLHPADVLNAVSVRLPPACVVMPDSGNHWLWAMRVLQNRTVNGMLPGRAFGAMGQATAGAVGASLAQPGKRIVVITGDGSFLMQGAEAVTAVACDLPILWILFNDSALGRILTAQREDFGGRVHATKFPPVDFSMVARGLGLQAWRVEAMQDLGLALGDALALSRPALIDVRISQTVGTPQ